METIDYLLNIIISAFVGGGISSIINYRYAIRKDLQNEKIKAYSNLFSILGNINQNAKEIRSIHAYIDPIRTKIPDSPEQLSLININKRRLELWAIAKSYAYSVELLEKNKKTCDLIKNLQNCLPWDPKNIDEQIKLFENNCDNLLAEVKKLYSI